MYLWFTSFVPQFSFLPANCKLIFFLQVYYAPMYKLKLMNEYEFMKIFGCLEVLLALHQGMNLIILYTLISAYTFTRLFSTHFLRCSLGEFV